MKKIYISGKISELDYSEVKEKFEKAGKQLKAWGFEPISPLNNGCTSGRWGDQMTACVPQLNDCEGIYMLKDWRNSKGAKIERAFAKGAGKFIMVEI